MLPTLGTNRELHETLQVRLTEQHGAARFCQPALHAQLLTYACLTGANRELHETLEVHSGRQSGCQSGCFATTGS